MDNTVLLFKRWIYLPSVISCPDEPYFRVEGHYNLEDKRICELSLSVEFFISEEGTIRIKKDLPYFEIKSYYSTEEEKEKAIKPYLEEYKTFLEKWKRNRNELKTNP